MNALLRCSGLAALLLAAGCGNDNMVPADAGGQVDSGPPKPALGGKLGAAVAAAESAQARRASAGGGKDGPPETGIFAPGLADAALAPTAAPKIEVINEGSDPKVALTLAPTGDEQKAAMTVSVRLAQGGLPAVDFGLLFKIERPKKDDKKDDKAPAAALPVLVKVTSVEPGKDVAARFPKDISDALAKFKGTEVRYQLAPNGVMSDVKVALPKDADPQIDIAVRSMVEALGLFAVPLPSTPIGVGGYWMVTDRSAPFNIDVVRYRVFKVQKIEKDHADLAVDIRQYSVRDEVDLGALAKGQKIKLDRFDSQGKGTISWSAGALLPGGNEVATRVMIAPAAPPGQRAMPIPLEIEGKTAAPARDEKKK